MSKWRSAVGHFMVRLLQIVVVPLTNLLDAVLSVQSLPDDLVGLHKLVDLLGQLVVLVTDNPDVVVHRFDLNLKVRVVFEEGLV